MKKSILALCAFSFLAPATLAELQNLLATTLLRANRVVQTNRALDAAADVLALIDKVRLRLKANDPNKPVDESTAIELQLKVDKLVTAARTGRAHTRQRPERRGLGHARVERARLGRARDKRLSCGTRQSSAVGQLGQRCLPSWQFASNARGGRWCAGVRRVQALVAQRDSRLLLDGPQDPGDVAVRLSPVVSVALSKVAGDGRVHTSMMQKKMTRASDHGAGRRMPWLREP